MTRQILIWSVILMLSFLTAQGRTKLCCFEIKGKVLDNTNKAIANALVVFHKGKWNSDTVYTDNDGNYKHIEAYWPPCDKKSNKKFWKTPLVVVVSYEDKQSTFEYIPREWLQVCEGNKPFGLKTMNRDIAFSYSGTVMHRQTDANMLTYKDSASYKEGRVKRGDTLYTEIIYDNPRVNDDELIYSLELIFIQPEVALGNKVLNLATDTSIVKSAYTIFIYKSPTRDDRKSNIVSGQIEIIEWTKRKVTIKQDITVYDTGRNEKRKFTGTRTFTKRGWHY